MARPEKRPDSKPAARKSAASRPASKSPTRSVARTGARAGSGSGAFKGVSPKKGEQPASLLLRDVDPEVVKVLKARAKRAGRSLQQELHLALRRDARRNFEEAAAISAAWLERLKGRDLPESAELLREDRGR